MLLPRTYLLAKYSQVVSTVGTALQGFIKGSNDNLFSSKNEIVLSLAQCLSSL